MDINWSKTFFMIVTTKRKSILRIPTFIKVANFDVDVNEEFMFLGVLLDKKLSFKHLVVNVCKKINVKLLSIKRLAYLPFSVKLQFFKTFILPLFDYCLSLVYYFSKSQIQTLENCYNACLFKLFKFDFTCKVLD